MKVFKKYSTARKASNGMPVVRVGRGTRGSLYIVPEGDLVDISLTEVSVLSGENGTITGHVTLSHLDRLGNANWASPREPKHPSSKTAFPKVTA